MGKISKAGNKIKRLFSTNRMGKISKAGNKIKRRLNPEQNEQI